MPSRVYLAVPHSAGLLQIDERSREPLVGIYGLALRVFASPKGSRRGPLDVGETAALAASPVAHFLSYLSFCQGPRGEVSTAPGCNFNRALPATAGISAAQASPGFEWFGSSGDSNLWRLRARACGVDGRTVMSKGK